MVVFAQKLRNESLRLFKTIYSKASGYFRDPLFVPHYLLLKIAFVFHLSAIILEMIKIYA